MKYRTINQNGYTELRGYVEVKPSSINLEYVRQKNILIDNHVDKNTLVSAVKRELMINFNAMNTPDNARQFIFGGLKGIVKLFSNVPVFNPVLEWMAKNSRDVASIIFLEYLNLENVDCEDEFKMFMSSCRDTLLITSGVKINRTREKGNRKVIALVEGADMESLEELKEVNNFDVMADMDMDDQLEYLNEINEITIPHLLLDFTILYVKPYLTKQELNNVRVLVENGADDDSIQFIADQIRNRIDKVQEQLSRNKKKVTDKARNKQIAKMVFMENRVRPIQLRDIKKSKIILTEC